MFVLLVAAELYGIKHNIEIGFPERPSLADFIGHCEATFRGEVSRIRPPNHPLHRFVIDSVKIFDDTLNRWVDLSSAHQLVEWSQLYLFQPCADASNPNEESQAILSAPVRIRSPMEVGKNKEKFFFLFHDMDFNGNGHLNREEVQRVFNVLGCFQISEKAIDAMFMQFDTNRDGVLSFAEFTKWMQAKPDVAELLLKKSLEYWQSYRQRRPEIRDSSEISAQERNAIEQYLERCRAAQNNSASAARIRSIKEIEDERLLLEREEELRRARDSFKNSYGRDLGVPSTSSMLVIDQEKRKQMMMMSAGQNSNNNSSFISASAGDSGSASFETPSKKNKRSTTPTLVSSATKKATTPKTAFGTTMQKTTPRPQTKASTAPKKRDGVMSNDNDNNQTTSQSVGGVSPTPAGTEAVPPSPSPVS